MKTAKTDVLNVTKKQQEIIILLYRYRFLNRVQIQRLMNHKDYRRINAWLKDLREKQYVAWVYSTDFAEKTKPAVYYLGINGIRLLNRTGAYPVGELRKRYKDSGRSETFRNRSMLIADCCINIINQCSPTVRYSFQTPADWCNSDSPYHFLASSDTDLTITPQLCMAKTETDESNATTKTYLLECFDVTLPRYRVRYRLKRYVEYIEYGEWESESGDEHPPAIMLVCPRLTDLIYAKRRIRTLLENIFDEDIAFDIRFTTEEKLREKGVIGNIWEAVKSS